MGRNFQQNITNVTKTGSWSSVMSLPHPAQVESQDNQKSPLYYILNRSARTHARTLDSQILATLATSSQMAMM